MKKFLISISILCLIVLVSILLLPRKYARTIVKKTVASTPAGKIIASPLEDLSIEKMRGRQYAGSSITIEQTLGAGSSGNSYIVSYRSDGNKVYALLTVPIGEKPQGGWPVIIFNHGYSDPTQYKTTGDQYDKYIDAFTQNGYIVFKSDYRGHGKSEGAAHASYYSSAYTADVLNAVASIKNYPDTNPNKIGMWGHSMGGNITLRSLVVDTRDIKAAVIWAGVVSSYGDLIAEWRKRDKAGDLPPDIIAKLNTLKSLLNIVGDPEQNPELWNKIDPTKYIQDITTPIQLHHGLADEEVLPQFSEELKNALDQNHKTVELYEYEGADHTISQAFPLAMKRTIEFFNTYLK